MNDARFWLLATVGTTACMWMPYVLDRFARIGIPRTLGNPKRTDVDEQSACAVRAKEAHANAIENLAVFAPLSILSIHLGLGGTLAVSIPSAIYFAARLAHYAAYAAGVPVVRTLAFLTGFGAQVALLIALANAGVAP